MRLTGKPVKPDELQAIRLMLAAAEPKGTIQ
jgi:hypothetical protein